MYTPRRITPMCPKCKKHNTYDIIPGLPNLPEVQLSESSFPELHEATVGNAKYYCMDCDYTWKKYRGRKPYKRIKVIHADAGGYPGPSFQVQIDLESRKVRQKSFSSIENYREVDQFSNSITPEEIQWFRSELYKCDFINWAEDYFVLALDGTNWSVRIEYDTHCEIKFGSNHFPPKWAKFCSAVSRVSGSKFY